MPTAYMPTPGTTPYRVIELLRNSDPLTSGQIADELDIEAKQLHQLMKTALAYGAVTTDKSAGELLRWRIGDGTPPAPPDNVPDEDPIVQRLVPAAPPEPPPAPPSAPQKVRRARGPDKAPRKAAKPRAAAITTERDAKPVRPSTYAVPSARSTADWQTTLNELARIGERKPMRCAVWNDGALTIEKNGHRTDLTVEESRGMLQMLRVLDRTISGEAEA